MSRPKLVATDLDGTLLDADGNVSDGTRAVLRELDAQGVPVVFVTGRPIRWMESLWSEVGGHGLAVCSNGGIVYDVDAQQVRSAATVSREVAMVVADLLRSEIPGTHFALEKTTGFARETGFATRFPDIPDIPTGSFEAIYDDAVVKVLALHTELAPEDYWRRGQALLEGMVEVTWSSSFPLLEMSAPGVTKASTLAELCAELAIDAADVVAFGDMPNDVEMLEWAGQSYAMAGGHAVARAAAREIAPAHTEDGVAQVLRRLFDL
ncbi:HAD family hydrolase [Nocardioides sp. Bht2]|uniref:HAD family hydrolase n=1 Tax=Nocardioides sp. Bht2 TaxID=3392297 RepID=UPI0039B51787